MTPDVAVVVNEVSEIESEGFVVVRESPPVIQTPYLNRLHAINDLIHKRAKESFDVLSKEILASEQRRITFGASLGVISLLLAYTISSFFVAPQPLPRGPQVLFLNTTSSISRPLPTVLAPTCPVLTPSPRLLFARPPIAATPVLQVSPRPAVLPIPQAISVSSMPIVSWTDRIVPRNILGHMEFPAPLNFSHAMVEAAARSPAHRVSSALTTRATSSLWSAGRMCAKDEELPPAMVEKAALEKMVWKYWGERSVDKAVCAMKRIQQLRID